MIPHIMQEPANPPKIEGKSNALLKIIANMCGMFVILSAMISSDTSTNESLGSADYDNAEEDRQDQSYEFRRHACIVEAERCKCGLQVVGSQHIVSYSVDQDDQKGKDHAQPSLLQCCLHVECGTTVTGSVFITFFIDLRQRRFYKGGCSTDKGSQPHPENCAWTSQADCCRYSDNISGPDSGCRGNHQRSKRRDPIFTFRFFSNNFKRFLEQTNLDEFTPECKVQPAYDQEHWYEPWLIQHTADRQDP